jgi:hypothetical protein
MKFNPSSSSKIVFADSSSLQSLQIGLTPKRVNTLPEVPIKPYENNNEQLQSNK